MASDKLSTSVGSPASSTSQYTRYFKNDLTGETWPRIRPQ
ncbi:hypothetical protein RSPO_m00120 (plasmid) [Ralstonia solanacearum Po82]|uniref:Uncharacterized protein n=1 Tax=Ralstonia solanacearum (strain Po82) TaxID=1031711 RepID=F6G798_RALS8|nr:hypothetical protein RSPO_m00120 [Ralstonia solanacearum Po82]